LRTGAQSRKTSFMVNSVCHFGRAIDDPFGIRNFERPREIVLVTSVDADCDMEGKAGRRERGMYIYVCGEEARARD
jgi:hypothetical protein